MEVALSVHASLHRSLAFKFIRAKKFLIIIKKCIKLNTACSCYPVTQILYGNKKATKMGDSFHMKVKNAKDLHSEWEYGRRKCWGEDE